MSYLDVQAQPPILTTSKPCMVHRRHVPNSHINHEHHVWPKGHGGPNDPENLVVVCATGHYNIHRLLEELLTHRGDVPYAVLRQFSTGEREYAKLGYDRIRRQAM